MRQKLQYTFSTNLSNTFLTPFNSIRAISRSSIFHLLEKKCSGRLLSLDLHWENALRKASAQPKNIEFPQRTFSGPLRPGVDWSWSRKENFKKSTSKKNNKKIWILKSVYGKHSIYFLDFLEKFKYSDRPFGKVLW